MRKNGNGKNRMIRDRMTYLDVSQVTLGAELGVHQSAISRILAGTYDLKFSQAVKLSKILGFSLDALADFFEPKMKGKHNVERKD